MTMTPNDKNAAAIKRTLLEAELDTLDVPSLPISDIIQVIADWAGHPDPVAFLSAIMADARANMSTDEALASDLLDLAIDSGTQLPQIRRAIEIDQALADLDI